MQAGLSKFRELVAAAENIVVLTGAGVSAESGIPTFRGAGGLWRTFSVMDLASPEAFARDPALVWQFYQYRRNVVERCKPNPGHYALAALERRCRELGKNFTLVTQNIDRLHHAAGSANIVELHGSLWLVKRVSTPTFLEEPGLVWEDRTQPVAPALVKCGMDDDAKIPREQLPHITEADGTRSMLRPGVVWFGESLDSRVTDRVRELLGKCDLLVCIGTSSVVYPAAMYATLVKANGKPVVEINMEATPNTDLCDLVLTGASGVLLPEAVQGI